MAAVTHDRALRSILPFAVTGNLSTVTNDDGIMYSGKCSRRNSRSSVPVTREPLVITT